jgi:hypothetical protein
MCSENQCIKFISLKNNKIIQTNHKALTTEHYKENNLKNRGVTVMDLLQCN